MVGGLCVLSAFVEDAEPVLPCRVVHVSPHTPHERPRENQPEQGADIGMGWVEPLRRVQHAAEEVEQRLRQVVRVGRDRLLALLSDKRDPGLQVPESKKKNASCERKRLFRTASDCMPRGRRRQKLYFSRAVMKYRRRVLILYALERMPSAD